MTPAIFIGHGSPMNAIESNRYTDAWERIGRELARPKAILSISAHWYIGETGVTVSTAPRTIHDFGGFPQGLYAVQYPAPGDPRLAQRVRDLLAPVEVTLDDTWGLDHGTWAVLKHMYPKADIPVVQLSIDATKSAAYHVELAARLAPLRDEGVLILGSGNVVHNLRAYAWGVGGAEPYDWATRFEAEVRGLVATGDARSLAGYEKLGTDALLAAPTPEHYLPLLYVAGTQQSSDRVHFPVEGIEGGSISMLAAQIG